jgi:hypothetical protein
MADGGFAAIRRRSLALEQMKRASITSNGRGMNDFSGRSSMNESTRRSPMNESTRRSSATEDRSSRGLGCRLSENNYGDALFRIDEGEKRHLLKICLPFGNSSHRKAQRSGDGRKKHSERKNRRSTKARASSGVDRQSSPPPLVNIYLK